MPIFAAQQTNFFFTHCLLSTQGNLLARSMTKNITCLAQKIAQCKNSIVGMLIVFKKYVSKAEMENLQENDTLL